MAIPKLKLNLDFGAVKAQFQGLQGRHPGLWPAAPKGALMVGLLAALMVAAYFVYWSGLLEELEAGRQKEETLKTSYTDKMKQAINLDVLRHQKVQVGQYVSQLEKQLPSKAEMDALLSDINQAGIGRGLQFDLFKPGSVEVKEYYAELPINIRLSGSYHDLGSFTSDVSNLPRIVTLNNLNMQLQEKSGQIVLEAVAKTFRYLDRDEIDAQRKAKAAKAGPPGANNAQGAAAGAKK